MKSGASSATIWSLLVLTRSGPSGRRLQAAERRPRVEYVPAFVGLAKDHPFLQLRAREDRRIKDHFEPWSRLSTAEAVRLGAKASQQSQPIFETGFRSTTSSR